MRNSSNDIYINGEYFSRNPGWDAEDSPMKARIAYELVVKHGVPRGRVVEVGCGVGGILKELCSRDETIASLEGYDISPQAIALAKPLENERLRYYNQDFLAMPVSKVDLLLVIDVIEHVDDFYTFLRKLKSRSSYFVFHIPLDLCCRTILKPHVMLQQRETVGHIHYFSKEMVYWMLKDTGYEIVDWVYTKPVIDIDPPDSLKRSVKKVLRNLAFSMNKDVTAKMFGGYSMMILAK